MAIYLLIVEGRKQKADKIYKGRQRIEINKAKLIYLASLDAFRKTLNVKPKPFKLSTSNLKR